MANNLFLMGFIIFLSDIYIYMYRWFLKNVDNRNQKSNKKNWHISWITKRKRLGSEWINSFWNAS